ncbi:hypothetical protein BJ741DRAFT_652875 [Chytriomyces cf. hyalinus JEL632]|nr:hypothetical protein BJ741DRAFT_652875 [Chytriomyces cf. hyalinus JEL632]
MIPKGLGVLLLYCLHAIVLAQQADRICRSSVCMDVQVDGSTAIITVQCSSRGWCAVGLGVSRMGDTNPATKNPIIVGWMNAGKPVVSLRNLPSDAMPVFGAAAVLVEAPASAQALEGAVIAFSVAVDAGLVADVNQNYIFAASDQPPASPGNAQSSFGVHSERGSFTQRLKLTDVASEQPGAAAQAFAPAPSVPAPPPVSPAPASSAVPVQAPAPVQPTNAPPAAPSVEARTTSTRQAQLSPVISTRQSPPNQADSASSRSEQGLIPPATIDPNDPGLLMDEPSSSAVGGRQSSTATRQTRTSSTRATSSASGETMTFSSGSSSSVGTTSMTSSESAKTSTSKASTTTNIMSASRVTSNPSNVAGNAFKGPGSEVDTGLILAVVLGGLAGLGVIGGLIFICVVQAKKRRPKHEPVAQYESGLRAANEGEFLTTRE